MGNMVGAKRIRVLLRILLVAITLTMMVPLVWMLLMSFKTNREILFEPLSLPSVWSLDNYWRALNTLNIGRMYLNTAFVGILAVGIALTITFLSSYALSRMIFRNRKLQKIIHQYLLLGLMISPFILLFPIYRLTVIFKLYNNFWSLILPYIATQISFNTLLFVNFFKSLPSEVEEAALIDGCTLPRLLKDVIFPMAKPVIMTVLIFNVLYVWNEYPLSSVLLRQEVLHTLSMGASKFKGAYSVDNAGIVAASVMIIVPQLIFYGFFQRYIVDGMTAGAIKG